MTTTSNDSERAVQAGRSYFYVWAAAACVAVAFLGFTPTYFAPLTRGTFAAHPIIHIHGMVFFSWTLFFTYQSWLVASGKPMRHRDIGLIGISLATAMTFLGLLAAISGANRAAAAGQIEAAKDFMIVPVSGIVTFAILFACAIYCSRQTEIHKRLMLIATSSILDAAVARWFLTFLAPPLPPGVTVAVPPVGVALPPAFIVDLIIVAGMVYDWRTRGKPHPVYFIAGGAVLVQQILRLPLSTTPAWDGIAAWLMGVMG